MDVKSNGYIFSVSFLDFGYKVEGTWMPDVEPHAHRQHFQILQSCRRHYFYGSVIRNYDIWKKNKLNSTDTVSPSQGLAQGVCEGGLV
ncbi:hypothetical protein OIU85_015109 [Salix viminalis]|uniref:Uncharacterized protein n=1 Tax=Salix viminalis TaxID=40686 RepID=A0A9Q0NKG6_SALVM|nr:hypothetical protein OIU85_015109 [Salix viminalis]